MSVTEYITRLTIKSARDLPKTDRLSKIDPYMVILVNGQQFRTKVKDDNENPDWNETFGARLLKHPTGLLQGSLELNLYDEDTFADSYVAKYVLDLSTLTQAQLGIPLTFSMEYVKDKYKSQGKHPTITVQFDGLVQSFYSLRSMFAPMPGFLTDDTTSACFIPITESNGLIYVCVDYDSGGKIDFKVYVTRPNVPIYLDLLVLAGAQYTKVSQGGDAYCAVGRQGNGLRPRIAAQQEGCGARPPSCPWQESVRKRDVWAMERSRMRSVGAGPGNRTGRTSAHGHRAATMHAAPPTRRAGPGPGPVSDNMASVLTYNVDRVCPGIPVVVRHCGGRGCCYAANSSASTCLSR